MGGCITGFRKQFGDRYFPPGQSFKPAAHGNRMRARTDREPPRHDRRTAWRTLRLNVEIRKSCACRGKRVDPRRRCPAHYAPAIAANLTVPEVVHQNENYVWFFSAFF